MLLAVCGRFLTGPLFSLYYDPEYKEEDADIEICAPTNQTVVHQIVKSRILPGGKALTHIHHGSYETIGEAYKVLIDALNQSKSKVLLPNREIYIKGPGLILPRNPKKFVTEIQLMLA